MKDAERCHSDRLKGFPIFQVFHTASRKISEACTYLPSTTVVAADCMLGVGQVFNLKRCKEFKEMQGISEDKSSLELRNLAPVLAECAYTAKRRTGEQV